MHPGVVEDTVSRPRMSLASARSLRSRIAISSLASRVQQHRALFQLHAGEVEQRVETNA